MAFADPVPNVTLATVSQTLGRISSRDMKSVYRKTDGSLIETISHEINPKTQRVRSMIRLDQYLDVNADLKLENQGVYLVSDRPITGFSQAQVVDLIVCLADQLKASTNAAAIKLFGLEN